MSAITPPRLPLLPLDEDIDRRIATACRLAQTSMPPLLHALDDTPLIAAARAYGEALDKGGDTVAAYIAYDAALNDFLTEFRIKLMHYSTKDVIPRE